MAGQVDESSAGLERTDELPVLSEEAIRRFERASETPARDAIDELDASVDSLRAALERAENRWCQLENRLEAQDRAIDELRSALGEPAAGPGQGQSVPELTDMVRIVTVAETPESAAEPAAGATEAAGAGGPAIEPGADRDELRPFLERIAELEAYIAGRADHWDAMQAEVEEKARRIAELEQELAQRIDREESLKQQLHEENGRSEGLRDRLQRANLRLETLGRAEVDVTD